LANTKVKALIPPTNSTIWQILKASKHVKVWTPILKSLHMWVWVL